jgi:ABC-type uncharacterized transport system permease subunit
MMNDDAALVKYAKDSATKLGRKHWQIWRMITID